MNKLQAYSAFWSGFGWPAYDENSVPASNEQERISRLPYITYETATDDFGRPLALTASLWDRSTEWTSVAEKESQISDFIGRGGRMIAYENGAMWIKRGSPWSQRMAEEGNDTIRRIVLNIELEFID